MRWPGDASSRTNYVADGLVRYEDLSLLSNYWYTGPLNKGRAQVGENYIGLDISALNFAFKGTFKIYATDRTTLLYTIPLCNNIWGGEEHVYMPPPPPLVGDEATSRNKLITKPELQIPWMWISTIILSLVATVVFVKLKEKKQQTFPSFSTP